MAVWLADVCFTYCASHWLPASQGVSAAELERRLAELRSKMEDMSSGGESGSAAFRCIACDRVLPDNNTWNPPPQVKKRGF
jgi:hypothetical protein